MAALSGDWPVIDGVATMWFNTASLGESAALAGRLLDVSAGIAVDLRSTGARVRLDDPGHAAAATEVARDLGLTADPSVLQQIGVVVEATNPAEVRNFWQRTLDYTPYGDGGLADPLHRDPGFRVEESAEVRPMRNRIHLDVVRPAAAVERAGLGDGSGPYGLRHVDPDGNEVDLVPGDPLDEAVEVSDWQAVFSAMACYRTTSVGQQRDLAIAVAALGDDLGFALLIDLRPGLVIIDSGKDQSDADAHGLDLDFTDLALQVQAAAQGLGATADPELPRFVQLFFDAADVPAVRAFWASALGHVPDRRSDLTDIHDPRRLGPVLVFQQIDTSETERLRQRNRIHVELTVPAGLAAERVAAIVAAGGRLLDGEGERRRIADPEGNELVVIGAP